MFGWETLDACVWSDEKHKLQVVSLITDRLTDRRRQGNVSQGSGILMSAWPFLLSASNPITSPLYISWLSFLWVPHAKHIRPHRASHSYKANISHSLTISLRVELCWLPWSICACSWDESAGEMCWLRKNLNEHRVFALSACVWWERKMKVSHGVVKLFSFGEFFVPGPIRKESQYMRWWMWSARNGHEMDHCLPA